jgi:uncharacterized cupredoxin-like copper-binding protein
MNHQRFLTAIGLAAVVLSACAGGPAATATPGATATTAPVATTPAAGTTTVNVVVQEFSINPSVSTAASGDITFIVANAGPDDIHEFVVLRTDLAPDALPTDGTGAVDESAAGMTVIDEIEDLAVGATEHLTVTLEAGAYVLICNIFDESEQEAHYQMGMYTGFRVE